MLQKVKLFVGPVSKNVVDSVIEYCEENKVSIGLIPSRRQIDDNHGYVNGWTTKTFSEYVKNRTDRVILERDHGGPNQGDESDSGFKSFYEDVRYFDILHIDPFKRSNNIDEAIELTNLFTTNILDKFPNCKFEVATEESICPELKNPKQLQRFLEGINLNSVIYVVIQSGTKLFKTYNIGIYDRDNLKTLIGICKQFNLLTKEHNGDYLDEKVIQEKMSLGLDAINIAPEFGNIETKVILEQLNDIQFEKMFTLCLESNRWKKWVQSDYNPYENKKELIEIAGHYIFSHPEFLELKNQLYNIDSKIKSTIKTKIHSLFKNFGD
jgi:hypothetical protein